MKKLFRSIAVFFAVVALSFALTQNEAFKTFYDAAKSNNFGPFFGKTVNTKIIIMLDTFAVYEPSIGTAYSLNTKLRYYVAWYNANFGRQGRFVVDRSGEYVIDQSGNFVMI